MMGPMLRAGDPLRSHVTWGSLALTGLLVLSACSSGDEPEADAPVATTATTTATTTTTAATTTTQESPYPYFAPTFELVRMLPGPITTQAVISAGPIRVYHAPPRDSILGGFPDAGSFSDCCMECFLANGRVGDQWDPLDNGIHGRCESLRLC